MFRRTIKLDERADTLEETAKLKDAARRAGVSEFECEQLGLAFQSAITTLVDAGRKMKQQGSRMSVRRTLESDNYEIDIHFGNVGSRGLFARLFGFMRPN